MTTRARLRPHGPVIVDTEDQHLVMQTDWHRTTQGYLRGWWSKPAVQVRLHRLIAGAGDGLMVDHINGDILDNRRSNLRICTNKQNQRNQRLRQNNSTGFKGVCVSRWGGASRRYIAGIRVNKRQIQLGRFASAEEAARAYDRAALEHFGEFAWIKFPQERAA